MLVPNNSELAASTAFNMPAELTTPHLWDKCCESSNESGRDAGLKLHHVGALVPATESQHASCCVVPWQCFAHICAKPAGVCTARGVHTLVVNRALHQMPCILCRKNV